MPEHPRILIIGATGFIGRQLLLHLGEIDAEVAALCRNPQKLPIYSQHVRVIQGDATDKELLSNLLPSMDFVINCAGSVRGLSFESFRLGNISIPKVLCSVMKSTASSAKLVHLSSLAARKPTVSHYAKSKWGGEQAIIESSLKDYVILRPSAVYGAGDKELKPLFDWMHRGVLFAPSPCNQRFSLLYVDDLCTYILGLLQQWPQQPKTVELDDGHIDGYSWQQLADIAAEVFQRNITLLPLPTSILRATAIMNMLFSRMLGYAPMLTSGKVNEFLQPNWVCAPKDVPDLEWQPKFLFRDGLAKLYNLSD